MKMLIFIVLYNVFEGPYKPVLVRELEARIVVLSFPLDPASQVAVDY